MLQAVCHTPVKPLPRHGNSFSCPSKFFLRGVSVRALFRVCFFETNVLWACPAFSIPVFSPVVRRGTSCSGNRGLGIVIRAENSRFFAVTRISGWHSCGARHGR